MRRWISRICGLFAVAFLGMLLELTPLGFELEQNFGLRWLFTLRGPVLPPSDVLVVGIDDQSGARLGLSKLPREWSRTVHARLVDELVKRGASVIIFDFDFQTPKIEKDDMAFAKAISAANRVVLTERLIGKRQPLIDANGQVKGALWVEQKVAPMPILAEAAKGAGTFPLPKLDVAVHEFWTFKRSVDYAPTTPAIALQLYAQSAYPKLAELMGDKDLPSQIKSTDRASEISNLMMKLRQKFEQSPSTQTQTDETLSKILQHKFSVQNPGDLNALISLYSDNDHRYLNFYGPPGTISTVPYYAVLESDIQNKTKNLPDFSGKVVFVGYSDLYDPSQPDRFYTVYTNKDGVDLSGVEIAATAFANLMTNHSLAPLDPALTAVTLLSFGCLIGGLTYFLPAIVSIPLILMIAVGYVFLSKLAFGQFNLWLPLAVPLLVQLPATLFFGLGTQYLSERRKKKRATQAISYYLPENLAQAITEKNLESTALNQVINSVCFASDMAGFTTISEQLPPKELAVFLNGYFESLSSPLRHHKVDVIEFRADGIMCAWTAENDLTIIRRRALIAALDAVEAIKRFSQTNPILTQHLRVGLETGMVYVGHSGGGGHFVYSIVGDCANTAARIEGLNKKMGTQILASRNTLEGVDEILTRYLGDFKFVGKSDALPILEVMALKENATDSQIALSRDYEKAMATLINSDALKALSLFETIVAKYPDDGPARFHLGYCQKLLTQPETNENLAIIVLDSK